MVESEVIKHVNTLNIFDKLIIYMSYYINMYSPILPRKSFKTFCSTENIITHNIGVEDWEERGFASKEWVVFNSESIYFYIYHNIN